MDGFVNWKVARFFALNELDDSRAANSWEGAELSEYPLVIYNGETGEPRYYEFRVVRGGSEIGAITCVAEKSEGAPVQYILPFAKEIAEDGARSIRGGGGRLVDAGYPGRLIMRQANSSRAVDAETGLEDATEYPVDMKTKEFLETADAETLAAFGITDQETLDAYIAVEAEKEAQLGEFWEEVDEVIENILSMTEEELLEAFGEDPDTPRGVVDEYSTYTLKPWYDKGGWYHPRGIICGANVVAFTMLGLGTASGYAGIPTTNNQAQLDVYYQAVEDDIGKGPKGYYWFEGNSLDGGLRRLTNGRYRLSAHYGTPFIVSHSWSVINSEIRNRQLPVISLRTSRIEKILTEWKWDWHYRTVVGTQKQTSYLQFKIAWWSAKIKLWDTLWYRMHDNGADGKNWWEFHLSLYNFQAASVVKN
jgi:hypothetical protein